MNFKTKINELKKNGCTILPNILNKKECKNYIKIFEKIVKQLEKNKGSVFSTCQFIDNPFRHKKELVKLIHRRELDKIFFNLLDKNYVLIDSVALNRKLRPDLKEGRRSKNAGSWHADSRYLNNKRLEKGFSYISITMFNDWTNDNSATLYVPKSHNRRDRPNRNGKYLSKPLLGKAGSIAIIDTGLWHKAGKSSKNNRWGVFNYYGPWFMKPYFDFPKMMGKKFTNKISKPIQRLLHYNSIPPVNELERSNTVTKL